MNAAYLEVIVNNKEGNKTFNFNAVKLAENEEYRKTIESFIDGVSNNKEGLVSMIVVSRCGAGTFMG